MTLCWAAGHNYRFVEAEHHDPEDKHDKVEREGHEGVGQRHHKHQRIHRADARDDDRVDDARVGVRARLVDLVDEPGDDAHDDDGADELRHPEYHQRDLGTGTHLA